MSTQCKTQGLKRNLFVIFDFFFFSVFLDVFDLNASGLSRSPGWPGPHSVAWADVEFTATSPTLVS